MSEILIDGNPISISYYPDGSPRIVFENNQFIRCIKNIVIRPKNSASFLASMFFLDALKERRIKVDRVTIPFISGSRQDRITGGIGTDFLFTVKSICKMINERACVIETFDPHSDVLSGLLDGPIIKKTCDIFNECKTTIFDIRDYDGIISPDAGSEKRCISIAKKFNISSIFFANKRRDISTGAITDIGISRYERKVEKGKYIVVDDICDGGSTFIGLAKSLKEDGMMDGLTVDLYITHGIFSKGTEELLKYYNKIYCTDSFISDKTGINVIKFFGENN